MEPLKKRLLPLILLIACFGVVGMSVSHSFADDHDEEFEDEEDFEGREDFDDEDEGDFEDEEEWEEEEWGMEEAMFEVEIMKGHLDMYHSLLEIVNGMNEVTSDPTATALMALHTAKDLAHEEEDHAEFLEEGLDKIKDAAVRRAIRLQLAELYAEMDQPERAREHLARLISGRD